MKKVKLLLTINIIQVVLLIASICAAVIFLPKVMYFGDRNVPQTVVLGSEDDKHNGFAQVTAYGAVANDGKDDTAAFKKAIATNASIYVPAGTFDLKDTIVIDGKTLKGSGSGNTTIRSSAENTAISLSGSCVVEDISVCFAEGALSGKEQTGEKVALLDNGLTQGSMIRGVCVSNAGTGFLSNKENGAFCTTIEAVVFDKFSYKAIEITNGMSAIIRSATIQTGANSTSTPVSLGGVVTIEAMAFVETECDYALELKQATSVFVKNVTFKKVKAASNSLINCDSARFTIQVATLIDTTCKNIVAVNEAQDAPFTTEGIVNMVYSDADASFSVSDSDKVKCEFNLK